MMRPLCPPSQKVWGGGGFPPAAPPSSKPMLSLLLQIYGTWYQAHWWTPNHMNKSHLNDNYAMTLSKKDGIEGQLIFKSYKRLLDINLNELSINDYRIVCRN